MIDQEELQRHLNTEPCGFLWGGKQNTPASVVKPSREGVN